MKSFAEKTIQSLRKINDFPFYTAKYYGDYKITEYRKGAIKNPNDVVPFFQSLFAELGKATALIFPQPPDMNTGCSAFYCHDKNGSTLIGKNNDWKKDPVLLLKTTPDEGFASLSMVNLSFCDFFKLGSFEHNILLAPYVPLDGMNEKGLVVTTLAVHEGAGYPLKPDCLSVGDFNIIRIILDTCKNIDEAVSVLEQYNIMQTGLLPIHVLISDKKESCIVEFFDGKIHLKRNNAINYLTNFLKLKNSDYDIQRKMCNRYQIIKNNFTVSNKLELSEAKELLKKVSVYTTNFQIPSTIWSVIYSPEKLNLKIRVGNDTKYYSVSL